jgi:phosphatidylglycerophosphate synthase
MSFKSTLLHSSTVTLPNGPRFLQRALAFKAYEIEELADVYFFRPLGAIIAYSARALGLTPTHLTVLAGVAGMSGGVLLYDERAGWLAFALLILHGILDSSDGQLARLTGRSTELGRVLDGLAGYATYAAIYLALAASVISRGGSPVVFVWVALAAASTMVHAQMYDYHRTSYASIGLKGLVPSERRPQPGPAWSRWIMRVYYALQRRSVGRHEEVEAAIAARSHQETVSDADRARYCAIFYWPVRGWNLLGDNTRFYAIGVLVWAGHLEWFFAFEIVVMNVAFAALWLWQRRADTHFLSRT